jgi:hypothetical protein
MVVAALAAAGLSGCGGTGRRSSQQAVPDVRGLRAPDAVVRLLKARYCVQLRVGTRVSLQAGMPVQGQAPPSGSTRRTWSTVTLTVGVPTAPGTPKGAHAKLGVDTVTWGGHRTPCAPIRTTG